MAHADVVPRCLRSTHAQRILATPHQALVQGARSAIKTSDAMHTQSKRERSSSAHVSAQRHRMACPQPPMGCSALRPAMPRTWTARERSSSACVRQGRRMPELQIFSFVRPTLRTRRRGACVSARGDDAWGPFNGCSAQQPGPAYLKYLRAAPLLRRSPSPMCGRQHARCA